MFMYNKLLNTFRSEIKTKIITLLIKYQKMTVTQMARYINTTRSNLYQNISEMLKENLVLPPEVIVKKNYVEKYYRLNTEAFNVSQKIMVEELLRLGNKEIKDMLKSFFMAQALLLNVLAVEIDSYTDEDITNIKNNFDSILTTFGSLSNENAKILAEKITEILGELPDGDEQNIFLFLIFPFANTNLGKYILK